MKSNSQFNAEVFKKYNNMIEEKNDKFFFRHVYKKNYSDISKIAIFFVVFLIVFIGTIYATIYVYNRKQTKLTPTYTETIGDTNMNNIWVGTFQLVWNEFIEQRVKDNVEFENENNNLVSELNKKSFTKEMLSEEDYYIKVDKTTPELKEEIRKDINEKFDIQTSSLLENINFNNNEKFESYTLYSVLFKQFNFINPFDKLKYAEPFADSKEKIQYFGINNASDEILNENVEVLFYNNKNEFAVKLKTKEKEEVLLYRTSDNKSFSDLYSQLLEKSLLYEGEKEFNKDDELKIPYINIDTLINYGELCGKVIKNTGGLYIQNALQNVKFSLNEKGGNLISEAGLKDIYLSVSENSKYFYFNDRFVLFLKEENKEQPYFALRVNNTAILVGE